MRFLLTALFIGSTPIAALSASQSEAESAFSAGKPVQNMPDINYPLVVREGALVCESAATFANDVDIRAASGDAKALEVLRSGCVNWRAATKVRVRDPMSNVRRYALAMRFGVLEFAVVPLSGSDAGDAAVGFVRGVNLLDGQPLGTSIPRFEVQIGPESDENDARMLREEVARQGFKPTIMASGSRFAVRLGPFASRADARKVLEQVQLTGLTAALVSPD